MNVTGKLFITRELHPTGYKKRNRAFYTATTWDKLVLAVSKQLHKDDYLVARVVSIHGQPQFEVGEIFFIHKHMSVKVSKKKSKIRRRKFFLDTPEELEIVQRRADQYASQKGVCFLVAEVIAEVSRQKEPA